LAIPVHFERDRPKGQSDTPGEQDNDDLISGGRDGADPDEDQEL